jgi:hypothetical protein
VHLGDLVCIDWDREHSQLTFIREGEGALVQNHPESEQLAAGAETKDGRKAEIPAETVTEGKKPRSAPAAAAPAAAPQARKKPER